MADVAAELGIPSAGLSLNDSRVRALAGKPTGAISFADLRGKSNSVPLVAGQGVFGPNPGILHIGRSTVYGIGSLTMSFQGFQVREFHDAGFSAPTMRGQLQLAGDATAALAGKSVYINGTRFAMEAPTYNSGTGTTHWSMPANTKFGLVNGTTYQVAIA
ncbi:hypothetical protein [Kaistia sp. 32K]|uniref:hypothetical protein n=1 Tax=Kaistia sp. 32K TaxID=2795690 RepID=UPI001915E1CF|nr:hypothetical protein [Kaistia sp. 32K]